MGGQSSSSQTQSSTTAPWTAAQPALSGILGQVGSNLNNTGVTGAENGALGTIQNNANGYSSSVAPQLSTASQGMFATGPAANISQNYYNQTNPLASNTNYNPYDTPGFKDAINTMSSDITNNVNGAFAAGGRDFSGMNSQTLGRGLAQGLAPTIASQYNQNVSNQQGAATNQAGILSGLNTQGAAMAGQGLDASNAGANATLQAEAQRRGIPVQALGLLAQIGIPIAGLGSQNTGQSQGTQQMSGAQQFGTIMQGFGQLIPKGPISFGGGS